MNYYGFIIQQEWNGTAINVETGEVREDNDFTYWSTEFEKGGRCHSVIECMSEIDEFLYEHNEKPDVNPAGEHWL